MKAGAEYRLLKKKEGKRVCIRAVHVAKPAHVTEQDVVWMWQQQANMGDVCLSSRSSALNVIYIFLFFLSWCSEEC